MSGAGIVDVRGLHKDYVSGFRGRSRKTALSDVSFSIPAGSIFALLGPNGAGKSTTFHILLGFLKPTSGSARMGGEATTSPAARRSLGFLPEVFTFDKFVTGRKLLERFDVLAGYDAPDRRARVDAALSLVNLTEDAGRKVGTYSKGMTQRIGLAQALLGDPELLILDEPMSGMDPASRRATKDLLSERRNRGRTTILSSHVLADIEELADHVVILKGGRVVANAPLDQLRRPSTAKRVVFQPTPAAREESRADDLPSGSQAMPDGRSWTLDVAHDLELNAVLTTLARAGATIVSVNAVSPDLEALFLELTDDDPANRRIS